ncbi:MAG: serine hydrolase, partial [Candidatus Sumerlaeia bacterium]|nr:serine hydrolase [Candidatus Sumerlaeia bacterium]
FDDFVKRRLNELGVPGSAVGIVNKRQMLFVRTYGFKNVAKKLPVTVNTNFLIASCTKAFTATAIGILVDEGKLDWDIPVRKYLPAFSLNDPVATERLTVRDLLLHRCGLPRHDWLWFNSPLTLSEICARLHFLEPSAEAGQPPDFRNKYQYNNLMFMVAGLLIEKVTKQKYEEFITDRIFKPLQMHSSRFISAELEPDEELAQGYYRHGNRTLPYLRGWMKKAGLNALKGPLNPAGGIVSNVLDMCRWLRLQLNQGKWNKKPIISEQNLNQLFSPQVVIPQTISYKERLNICFGMGWIIEAYRGYRLIRHSGNLAGFSASVSFLPDESLGVVVLTNRSSSLLDFIIPFYVYDSVLGLEPIPWHKRLMREALLLEKTESKKRREIKRQYGTQPSHPARDYAGEYEHPGYGRVTIVFQNGELRLNYQGIPFRLRHYHY